MKDIVSFDDSEKLEKSIRNYNTDLLVYIRGEIYILNYPLYRTRHILLYDSYARKNIGETTYKVIDTA